MATVAPADSTTADEALYPIAVLIDELRNEDVQVNLNPKSLRDLFSTLKNCPILQSRTDTFCLLKLCSLEFLRLQSVCSRM